MSGMIRCSPASSLIGIRVKSAVRSGVSTPPATKLNCSVLASSEKLVTVSSLVERARLHDHRQGLPRRTLQ